jgi:hypothetical protein
MADSGEETAGRSTEAGIYTETLARLYLLQGFADKALRIYRHLVQAHPENLALHEQLRLLEQQMAGQVQENVPSSPVRTVAPAMTNGPSFCSQWVLRHLEHWLYHLQQRRTVRENAVQCEGGAQENGPTA